MSSNEQFGPSIIPTVRAKLVGHNNYGQWSGAIMRLAEMLKLRGVLDGSIPRPAQAPSDGPKTLANDPGEWDAADGCLGSIIEFNCEQGPANSIAGCESAHEMWEALKTRYQIQEGKNLSDLLANVIRLRHDGRNETFEEFLAEFNLRWSRLTIACVGAKEGTPAKALRDFAGQEVFKVSYLLTTLPFTYRSIVEVLRMDHSLRYADAVRRLRDFRDHRLRQNRRRG